MRSRGWNLTAYPLAVTALVAGIAIFGAAQATTAANTQSALGINLAGVSSFSSESPFMNVLANNSSGWTTVDSSGMDTAEESSLQLDSNGYVTSLPTGPTSSNGKKFNAVQVTLNSAVIYGQYTVTYQGAGTIVFGLSTKVVSSSTGQYVIKITQNGGANLTITSTDPQHTGNYIRNISIVPTGSPSGQLFNPAFLSRVQNFRVLRFMDWFSTNTSKLSAWANRPLQSNAFWGGPYGVPVEIAVQAANAVQADAWLNVPTLATDDYIKQMATLVHNQLGSTQKAYVEYSNEVWNSGFMQNAYASTQGKAAFPNGGAYADYALNWYGVRVAQMCDIWKTVWGPDSKRVICVMGAQAAVTATAVDALTTPLWTGGPALSHGIDVIAIAPYFAYEGVPSTWASQPDSGLTLLFQAMTTQNDPSIPVGGFLGEANRWVAAYAAVGKTYNLPIVAYEGGQGFSGLGQSTAVQNLYYAANRDPRMAAAYATYLQQWKANGAQLFAHYNDIAPVGVYGEWGALESITQSVSPLSSAPPKWQALQTFISTAPCWWPGCVGTQDTTGGSPTVALPPSDVTVQ